MNAAAIKKEIAVGLALAALTLCAGVWLSVRAGDPSGPTLMRIFGFVAIAIVVKYTFAWGRLRGFPAKDECGQLHPRNVIRNLVASAIVFFCVMWVSGPFMLAIVQGQR